MKLSLLRFLFFSICLKVKRIRKFGENKEGVSKLLLDDVGGLRTEEKLVKEWFACQFEELNKPRGSAKPEDGSWSMGHLMSFEEPQWGQRMWGKLLERDTSYLHIECPTPTISTALMWKWHLNSNFTACSPFYHLQQSFNGTSILRNALRQTSEEVGCKEEGYKRKRASQKQRRDFDFL